MGIIAMGLIGPFLLEALQGLLSDVGGICLINPSARVRGTANIGMPYLYLDTFAKLAFSSKSSSLLSLDSKNYESEKSGNSEYSVIVLSNSLLMSVPTTSMKESSLDAGSLTANSLAASSLTKAVFVFMVGPPTLHCRSIGAGCGCSTTNFSPESLDIFTSPGEFVKIERVSSSIVKR